MKFRIAIIVVLVVGFGHNCLAQSNTVSSGTNLQNSSGSVSYTVGQIDFRTSNGSAGVVSEGVQQPAEFFIVNIAEHPTAMEYAISAYPNPASHQITVALQSILESNLDYALYDLGGQLIHVGRLQTESTTINLQQLAAGNYILQVYKDDISIKSIQIIKSH